MEKSDLTKVQWQALFDEVRKLLIYQAQVNRAIGYGRFSRIITTVKIGPTDPALHDVLGEVSVDEHRKGNGMLSVFVGIEDTDDHLPGKGFFKLAMNLGITIGNWKAFVKAERAKVHGAFKDSKLMTF
jgi:hypothetical protein